MLIISFRLLILARFCRGNPCKNGELVFQEDLLVIYVNVHQDISEEIV